MPEASRTRPAYAEVLHVLRGQVSARPRSVFEAIAARVDPGPGAESHFLADSAAFLVVTQGGWWYRAEYRVIPGEHGSHVEHTLLNVAQHGARLGRFTGRKVINGTPAAFERLLSELRAELQ
ncbi:MAG: hypothetical protein ABIW81_04275 [Terrimesophilobacter sp.]